MYVNLNINGDYNFSEDTLSKITQKHTDNFVVTI